MLEADGVGHAAAQHPVDERLRAHVGETDLVGIGNELSSDLFEQFRERPEPCSEFSAAVTCSRISTAVAAIVSASLSADLIASPCRSLNASPTTSPSPDVGGVGRPLKTR